MKIAILGHDVTASEVLAFVAKRRGHQTVVVPSISELLGRLPFEPQVIVLDGALGDEAMTHALRVRSAYPDATLVVALEKPKEPLPSALLKSGVQDVIRAPYNPVELVIRAENLLAAGKGASAVEDTLKIGDLELALDKYTATKNGHRLNLTKLELRLLYCLCEHAPHLTPTERLLTFGWDTLGDPDAGLVKTHISHLRKKLREAGGIEVEISSRQTLGYTLQVVGGKE